MQMIKLQSADVASTDAGASASPAGDVWIDIDLADAAGRDWLANESGLDEEIVDRLLAPTAATFWRRFRERYYLNLHAAVPGEDPASIATIHFGTLLEPGRIITVRHGRVDVLESAAEACSNKTGPANSWALMLFVLFEGLGRVERNLHELIATIDQLEDEVLMDGDDPPIHRIAALQKRLMYARRFRMPLANMVSFISAHPDAIRDGDVRDDLEGITNSIEQHQQLLALSVERATALQGQIRDELADSMNAATYRFTWVATVFLPLGFLTGLLGINVAGVPGDHNPLAFWLVCAGLCIVGVVWGFAVGRLTGPESRSRRLASTRLVDGARGSKSRL